MVHRRIVSTGKCFLFIILFFTSSSLWAQNSLLWEITTPLSAKKSYLYGTMHVSEKIAFHLSDEFFNAILSTDCIGLESDPADWLESYIEESNKYKQNNSRGLYLRFDIEPLHKDFLKSIFYTKNNLLNGVLYRESEGAKDYQEDTFLDLFIYQIGKRTNREIISLENLKESTLLMDKAYHFNQDFEPKPWAIKMIEKNSYNSLLENSYRDKDLSKIDSLNIGFNSDLSLKYMLTDRNAKMVDKMDSIIKAGASIFSAVGASHLPGMNGMLEMLKQKGYRVAPVVGNYTEVGKLKKKQIENNYARTQYVSRYTNDSMIQLPVPGKLYDYGYKGNNKSLSLDIQNGAYIYINRQSHYNYINNTHSPVTIETVDSLLYENIPGNILSKKKMIVNGHPALDVESQTKSGDYHKYRIILTPLEVINIAFIGKGEYVKQKQDMVFNQIRIKPPTAKWTNLSPYKGGVKVNLPDFYTIDNNSVYNLSLPAMSIQAYDPKEKAFYLIIDEVVDDVHFLEETDFEHRRIHYNFAEIIEADTIETKYIQKEAGKFFQSKLYTQKMNPIYMRTMIEGSHYYLLATNASYTNAHKFLESFEKTKFNQYKDKKLYIDSALLFQAYVPIDPGVEESDFPKIKSKWNKNNPEDLFRFNSLSREFISESGQVIKVEYQKRPRYEFYEHIDSLWSVVKKGAEKDSLQILSEKKYRSKGFDVFDVYLGKEDSDQKVKARYLSKGQQYYKIKTLVNKNYKEDDSFVETFYNTFTPADTLIGEPITKRKAALFFEDVYSVHDSIRYSALQNTENVKFDKADLPALKKLLTIFTFKPEEQEVKNLLLESFSHIDSPEALSFLKEYYTKNKENGHLQISIIDILARSKDVKSYADIDMLMETDLPLSNSSFELDNFFKTLNDNPKKSAKILPSLLNYFSVPEYQENLLTLTNTVLDSVNLSPQKIKKHKKSLLTHAKLEMKRAQTALSKKGKYHADYQNTGAEVIALLDNYKEDNELQVDKLLQFSKILSHFKGKEVEEYFDQLRRLNHQEVKLFFIDQEVKNKKAPNTQYITDLSDNLETRFNLYKNLDKNNMLSYFPEKYDMVDVALSAFVREEEIDLEKDSVSYYTCETIDYKGKLYDIYFFKLIPDYKEGKEQQKIGAITFLRRKEGGIDYREKIGSRTIVFLDENDLKTYIKSEKNDVLHKKRKRYRARIGKQNRYYY